MLDTQKSYETSTTSYGVLYLVPTPIGNLSDMTPRAIDTLKEVDLIAAEDTRHTQKLLNNFDIDTKKISLHEHNWKTRVPELIDKLQAGINIAQVSDAGMPSISDPGKELVRAAIDAQIKVVPLPGATASLTALIASGLAPEKFYFIGFLQNRKESAQKQELAEYVNIPATLIFYESPYRIKQTLKNLLEVFGNRKVVLARELTKRYEEFIRGTLEEVLQWAENNEPKGEFVVMLDGFNQKQISVELEDINYLDEVKKEINEGKKATQAIKAVAKKYNLNRQELYNQYLDEKDE